MLDRTAAYDAAVVGSHRHIFLRAVVDISDPDKVWLPGTGSPQAAWSRPEQLHDRNFDAPPRYATAERGRWLLDETFDIFPDGYRTPEPEGYASDFLSGPEAPRFNAPPWAAENFSDMDVLQACSVFFSTDPLDGFAVDFTVEVLQGGTAYFSKKITGNRETSLPLDGFTVYNPDSIRVTVTRWSLPGRRARMVEIIPGIYEDWDADKLEKFSVTQQGQFSCLSLPYGTAEIGIDNQKRRFDPRRKDGVFQSIEERQGVELYIGVGLPGRGVEYKGLGMYYQAGDGWKTSENDIVMVWSLVDIIGLVAERTFLPPEKLPETLAGWIAAVAGQMGEAFRKRWHVDPRYADLPVTASSREAVTKKKCGDIIRWACQAAGTWPRADQSTGRITVEPLWNQGAKVDLDNLVSYPAMRANESLAALIFQLADEDETEYVVSGNSTSSEKTVTIINPFLHTPAQAMAAARLILAQYGGNIIETTGRGNPASEIGDVDTIWLDESNAVTARRMMQTFEIRDGALRSCKSKMLVADGSYLWTESVLITVSGKWRAPPGKRQLRIAAGQGGQGGGRGQDGQQTAAGSSNISFSGFNLSYGQAGVDGSGGMVWFGVIDINPEQEFDVRIGAGGAPGTVFGEPGALGGHTTFGAYSSEDGQLYPGGYTDIANGQAFSRPGVEVPLPGTGDGGKGGAGGDPGEGYVKWVEHSFNPDRPPDRPGTPITGHNTWVQTKPPGPGQPGAAGGGGFVLVSWEKTEETRNG